MTPGPGTTDGVAWDLWSEGPAVPLVALHGVTDDGGCFAPVLDGWTATRTVLTVDARGHGRTPLGAPPFSVPALAADVATVLDAQLGRPAVVLGHSTGGLVAEELALTRPDLVAALVLEDPAWRVADDAGDGTPRGVPAGIADWIREATSTPSDVLEAGSRLDNPAWSDAEHRTWVASKARLDPRLAEIEHDWRTRPWVEDLARLTVPVTVVVAADGASAVPIGAADRAAAILGPLLTTVRTDVGHSVRREAPHVVVRAVLDALRWADARACLPRG